MKPNADAQNSKKKQKENFVVMISVILYCDFLHYFAKAGHKHIFFFCAHNDKARYNVYPS